MYLDNLNLTDCKKSDSLKVINDSRNSIKKKDQVFVLKASFLSNNYELALMVNCTVQKIIRKLLNSEYFVLSEIVVVGSGYYKGYVLSVAGIVYPEFFNLGDYLFK